MDSHKYKLVTIVLAMWNLTSILAQLQAPPLQDFCVADFNTTLFINGRPCIEASKAEADDFFYSGPLVARVETLPGINTLGLQISRLIFDSTRSLNPPHYHPRAAEMVVILQGTIEAGFVTSAPDYRLFSTVLEKGDVFVVPPGLIHFQVNAGKNNATAEFIVFFNGDRPGVIRPQSNLLFAEPSLPVDLLAKTFGVDEEIIKQLQNAPLF